MFRSITLILIFIMCQGYAVATTVSIEGSFKNNKIDRYCLRPTENTDVEISLQSQVKNCLSVYAYTSQLGEDCEENSYLHLSNLKKNTTYYTIEARLDTSTSSIGENINYTISAKGDNFEFGLCPTESLTQSTNISAANLSFMLSLAGLFTGVIFFGSITYITLTIKEW